MPTTVRQVRSSAVGLRQAHVPAAKQGGDGDPTSSGSPADVPAPDRLSVTRASRAGDLGETPPRAVCGYLGGERAGEGFHQLPDLVDCLDGSGILLAVRDSPQPSDEATDNAMWLDCRALANDSAHPISCRDGLDLRPRPGNIRISNSATDWDVMRTPRGRGQARLR